MNRQFSTLSSLLRLSYILLVLVFVAVIAACPGDGGSGTQVAENTAALCSDGIDNDGDGYVDCDDFDCSGISPCDQENTAALCSDGIDNDGDGYVDCDDFDCSGFGSCP